MDWQQRALTLEAIVIQLHWSSRRYFEGRSTSSVYEFNRHTRTLLALGVPLHPTADGTLWARDGMGRAYDGLTDAEAAECAPSPTDCHLCGHLPVLAPFCSRCGPACAACNAALKHEEGRRT